MRFWDFFSGNFPVAARLTPSTPRAVPSVIAGLNVPRVAFALAAALVCTQIPTQRAEAQTLLSDDFEGYAPGTFPISGGWVFRLRGTGGNTADQQVDNTVSVSGTNSLRMVGAGCGSVNAYHPLALPSRFKVEASAMIRQIPSSGCSVIAGGVAAVFPSEPVGIPYGAVAFYTNGWLCAVLSTNAELDRVQLVQFNTNTWYRIAVTIDLDRRSFDVDINGNRRGTALSMPTNGLPTGIEVLSGQGTNAVIWYDDVAVFVPTNGAWLQIHHAVELLFQTEPYKSYQLQYAAAVDATNWSNLGDPFVGTGSTDSVFQPTRNPPQRFYRLQDLGCAYTLSTNKVYLTPDGTPSSTIQLATAPGCAWAVENPCISWLTITPTNGIGDATVTFQATRNNSGSIRTCTVTVGGQSIFVTQDWFPF